MNTAYFGRPRVSEPDDHGGLVQEDVRLAAAIVLVSAPARTGACEDCASSSAGKTRRSISAPGPSRPGRTLMSSFVYRATEMDITMIGLQNAGKTSLLRVLAVSSSVMQSQVDRDADINQGGEFTVEYVPQYMR